MEMIGLDLFKKKATPAPKKRINPDEVTTPPPGSRISSPGFEKSMISLKNDLAFVKPAFFREYIPIIRKLLSVNSSVSLATSSVVQLANTGYNIKFDKGVPDAQAIIMRAHLAKASKHWGPGLPGLHGIINKLIYQLFIGGAASGEWVIKNDLTGISYLALVNPEKIEAAYDYKTNTYLYFQIGDELDSGDLRKASGDSMIPANYRKLNPMTYQYYGLIGDTESPIGIPPFLSALDDLQSQLKMLRNIGYVSDQLGIMGFLEVLMAKPQPNEGEAHAAYQARLINLLDQAKVNVADGVKDGIVAGYIDDHEFEFHSSTKETQGVADIFDINQRMVSNGLLTSPQFLGGSMGGSETMITVVFTKMLSQLSDVQAYVKAVIERGLSIELTLQGYKFEKVELEFKTSTITDEVKMQQAREIKQRVARMMYADGLISQEQHAWEMGLDKADKKEPRVEIDPTKVMADQQAAEKKEKGDQANDRNSRAKKKDQPKGKDSKNK